MQTIAKKDDIIGQLKGQLATKEQRIEQTELLLQKQRAELFGQLNS
jgi:hypothetical protein